MKTFAILLIAANCTAAHADDSAATIPYRAAVSSSAQLPEPDQIEIEMGAISSRTNELRRNGLPYQLTIPFSDEWGVMLGGDAYVSERNAGSRAHGTGDTHFTLKRAFLIDNATAFGLELSTKIPTAKDSIGSGKEDYALNGIFSQDFGDLHMDLNLISTRMGALIAGTSRMQTGWAAALSSPITEKWGALVEVSGARQNGVPSTAEVLTTMAYRLNKRMTFDFGVAKGLNKASPNWSVFTGIVMSVANPW